MISRDLAPLSTDDLVVLSRLLDEVLVLSSAQADEWLAGLDAKHRHLRPHLQDMLAAHRATTRAESPFARLRIDGEHADETAPAAGQVIGPYRLIRVIGRGGMGTVWLAERADGNLKRMVAMKLPRLAWGDGLAARMLRERDIGTLLEHPNIARLYDAGVDGRGRPYLAFEYIDGETLDAWCAAHPQSTKQRLALFLQVVDALSYAHGRLVIHRDIKPSNVMVTADGIAHLLDFGIAKFLHGDDQDHLTQDAGRAVSWRYAAPEQLRGEPLTVAADLYSLGVVFCELLTGVHPALVGRSGIASLARREDDRELPLASSLVTDRTTAAELRGELDAILAKAMRRNPVERYASADAFADDIRRHLAGDRVIAQPDRLAYRCRRLVRRHWAALGATTIVMFVIVAGSLVSIVQAHRANLEAERARLVKEFVVEIFESHAGEDGSLASMSAQALLERRARTVALKFASQPELQAELYGVVAHMFFNVAEREAANDFAMKQIDVLARLPGRDHEIAQIRLWLANTLIMMQRNDEAAANARAVLGLAGGDADLIALAHARIAEAQLFGRSETDAAKVELDAAEAEMSRRPTSEVTRSTVLLARGQWLSYKNEPEEAARVLDQAIALGLTAEGPTSLAALYAEQEAAKILLLAGRVDAGRKYLQTSIDTLRSINGPDDVNAALWETYGAYWLYSYDAIPFAEAKAMHDHSHQVMQVQGRPPLPVYAAGVAVMEGSDYRRWGDVRTAYPLVVRNVEASRGNDELAKWWKGFHLIRATMLSDRASDAPAIGRAMLSLKREWKRAHDLRTTYDLLALAFLHARRYGDAAATRAEYEALPEVEAELAAERSAHVAPDDSVLLVALADGQAQRVVDLTEALVPKAAIHAEETAWLSRAQALCLLHRHQEALDLFEQWLPRVANDRYEASPTVAFWRAEAGLCALRAQDRRRAVAWSALASDAIRKQPEVSPHFKSAVVELELKLRTPLARPSKARVQTASIG